METFYEAIFAEEAIETAARNIDGWQRDLFLKAVENAIETAHNDWCFEFFQSALSEGRKEIAAVLFKNIIATTVNHVIKKSIPSPQRITLLKAIINAPVEIKLFSVPFSLN